MDLDAKNGGDTESLSTNEKPNAHLQVLLDSFFDNLFELPPITEKPEDYYKG